MTKTLIKRADAKNEDLPELASSRFIVLWRRLRDADRYPYPGRAVPASPTPVWIRVRAIVSIPVVLAFFAVAVAAGIGSIVFVLVLIAQQLFL